GDSQIKQYQQPITNFRDLKFDRFQISNGTNHPLNGPGVNGLMMGKDECTSPSGFYDLEIPINKTLPCTDTKMRDTNCKDLDVTKFTKMNVWVHYIYWSKKYPQNPDNPICKAVVIE
ncbi:unnamed protein product, partial [Porites lobata]